MEAAGLDPENPPTTLEELEEQAVACTVKADDGSYEIMGFPVDLSCSGPSLVPRGVAAPVWTAAL